MPSTGADRDDFRLDCDDVTVLFAHLQPRTVADSGTLAPKLIEAGAAALAAAAAVLRLPMLFSLVPGENDEQAALPALAPYVTADRAFPRRVAARQTPMDSPHTRNDQARAAGREPVRRLARSLGRRRRAAGGGVLGDPHRLRALRRSAAEAGGALTMSRESRAVTTLFAAVCVAATVIALPAEATGDTSLVGAWRLVEIDEIGQGGTTVRHRDLTGSLIYTADSRLSVQVLYPDTSVNNDYATAGYEASFGHYTVDPAAHRLVHIIEGANVRALVGRSLPRTYQVSGSRLTIGPAGPNEHWSVIWERQ